MLYAVLCYHSEKTVFSWTRDQDDAVMAKLNVVHERLQREQKLGPFAETKEQLLGFYVLDCAAAASSRCPTKICYPTSTMPKPRSRNDSIARTTAMTYCDSCLSAAIPISRRPSRSRLRSGSSRACP